MPLPKEPVTLSVERLAELEKKLAALRHNVNNSLSLIVAAAEIIRRQPERADKFWDGLIEKPHAIAESVSQFSIELEKALRIRPS
jgi:hypothetical protein